MLKRPAVDKIPSQNKRPRHSEMTAKSEQLKFKVFVRVRPFNNGESQCSHRKIVDIADEQSIIFDPEERLEPFFFRGVPQKGRDVTRRVNKNMLFEFDRVYDENSTNSEVYEGSTKDIISSIFEGYNCSVFAYGATGAGKTFTMLGTQDQPGIAFLTIVELLEFIEKSPPDMNITLGASYLEVYNENVKDLLNPSSAVLQLREDGARTIVSGLQIKQIKHSEELFTLLTEGNRNRTQHPTDSNEESSRSHAVFQVYARIGTKREVKISKLSMIDLAGSERGSATGCKGIRFKEGANINKSLLALGNCINALADGLKHVPYRDSKLTRILKDSLGGNCRTIMIANISPSSSTFEDTYNTLKYASRAKCLKTRITQNILNNSMSIPQYKKQVQELNEKLALIQENGIPDITPWIGRIESVFEERRKIYKEILSLQSQAKLTDWRIQVKEQVLSHCDQSGAKATVLDRRTNSISQLKARSESIRGRLNEFLPVQDLNKQQISKLEEEINAQGKLTPILKAFFEKNKQSVEIEDHKIRLCHLERLIKLKTKNEYNLTLAIDAVVPLLNEYHSVIRGHSFLTTEQISKYEDALRSLDGVKGISWCDDEEEDDQADILHLRLNSIDEIENDILNRTRTLTTTMIVPSTLPTFPLKQNNRLGNTMKSTNIAGTSKFYPQRSPFKNFSSVPSNKENIRRAVTPVTPITKVKPAARSTIIRPHPYHRKPLKPSTPVSNRMKIVVKKT